MSEPASAYDPFARMYDRHWGMMTLEAFEPIEAHVLSRLPDGARVLDLCCGTGQVTHALGERGYDVVGIDASEGMLGYARRNAPDAELYRADARSFELERPVDAVVCLFDSLNHLLEEEDLLRAFRAVHAAVVPGGAFAFDLNMEAKYLHTWAGEFGVRGDHEVGLVRCSVVPEERLGIFDVTVFYEEAEGHWSRHDVRFTQTWYAEATVARLLADAGFEPPFTTIQQPLPDDPSVARNLLFVTRSTSGDA